MRFPRSVYVLSSAGLTAAALLTTPLAALASWDATASDTVTAARALILPVGPVPTSTAHASTVTVEWSAAGGVPVRGYHVVRTDLATGETVAAGNGCAGLRPKTGCREVTVPDGAWEYGVVMVVGAHWTSAPGFGAAVVVASARQAVVPAVSSSHSTAPDAGDEPTAVPVPAPTTTPAPTTPATTTPATMTPVASAPGRTPDAATPSRTPNAETPSPTPTTTADPTESSEPAPSATPPVQGR
jgi:hypothetical protein